MSLLAIRNLEVAFAAGGRELPAVRGIDLDVGPEELVAVVGESGSGKSVSMLSVLGLLGPTARISGSIAFDGTELVAAPAAQLRAVRGRRIGMIFQDPLTSLNPVHTVGRQLAEAVLVHNPRQRKRAAARAGELLELVSITDVGRRLRNYPHELSGGMRQRVMIAMALANDPDLLIADEPTTALDVTIQAQILEVIAAVQRERRLAVVLVTHDLGVVAGLAQRVVVMYGGRVVEQGGAVDVFHRSNHPYTRGLLGCLPRLDRRLDLVPIGGAPPSLDRMPAGCAFHPRCRLVMDRCRTEQPPLVDHATTTAACFAAPLTTPGPTTDATQHDGADMLGRIGRVGGGAEAARGDGAPPLLEVDHLVKSFPLRGRLLRRSSEAVHAISDVSFRVDRGETLSLVGESGCGKSTTARCVLRIVEPDAGAVRFDGTDLTGLGHEELRRLRRRFQMVFQDPQASLNPRMRVGELLAEPLRVHGIAKGAERPRVAELIELVQLPGDAADRYPHQFSGGQRQRIGIARALAVGPDLLVLDEPVSALDVSIQAEVIRLLERLRADLGLGFLFIAHDLSVVRHLSDRVAVMYLGRIVETGTAADVYDRPAHPYTQALLSAAPIPDPLVERGRRRIVLTGEAPTPIDPPSGCAFRTRCWKATDRCAAETPTLDGWTAGTHHVACHHAEENRVLATSHHDGVVARAVATTGGTDD